MKMKRVVFYAVAVVVTMACFALAAARSALAQEDKDSLVNILVELKSLVETCSCKSEKKAPRCGCGKNCIEITKNKLEDKLQQHKSWLETREKKEKKGERAGFQYEKFVGLDISSARLKKAVFENSDLREANFELADLCEASFRWTDLREANFNLADLREAKFIWTDLSKAKFISSDLREAEFISSTLRGDSIQGAKFSKVKLKGTVFNGADFKNVSFEPEPGQLPEVNYLFNAKNLSAMTYKDSPHGLVELRNAFKKYGMRQQEREMTFAIKHNERIKESGRFWSGFQYAFFEFPVGWGMYPERALFIMACLVPFFAVLYFFPLGLGTWRGGTIWMRWRKKRATNLNESDHPRPLKRRGWRRAVFALYFSLLSTFHIGWRDLNVGTWITRMQPREYTLQATGWVRVISGVQSLISVYLLALAILSYFGRPFE